MANSNEPQQPNVEQDQATAGQGRSFAQATITSILSSAHSSLPDNNNNNNGIKRPRDARLIHLILAAWGVSAYEERIPLQLLDFAYRYTTNVLQDALYMSSEGYASSGTANKASGTATTSVTATASGAGTGSGAGGAGTANSQVNELNAFNVSYVKLGIENRNRHQHNNEIPKDFLFDLAHERNKVALPSVGRDWGVRLPPEKFCLTGVGWSLKEDWPSPTDDDDDDDHHSMDTDDDDDDDGDGGGDDGHSSSRNHHQNVMSAAGNHHHRRNHDDDDDDDDDTRMEDLFGDSLADGNGHDHDGDGLENDVQGHDRNMTDH